MWTRNSKIDFVRPSVGPLVMVIKLENVKTRISAPAHPSATGIDRVSSLVPTARAVFIGKNVVFGITTLELTHFVELVFYLRVTYSIIIMIEEIFLSKKCRF